MPLPDYFERKKLHNRQIHCEGYKRVDGLWDIEAHLVDKRTFDCSYDEEHRGGVIEAGEPVHDMYLRISIDIKFVIKEVHAVSDSTPFNVCPKATAAMQKLIGLRISAGWIREARKRIGPSISCTHLMDLLPPIAATAYQTLYSELEEKARKQPKRDKPAIIDTCLALASDGEVVSKRWPEFFDISKGKHTK